MISTNGIHCISNPQIVSLFSGCGGLDLGFRQAGFEPVLALDRISATCRTYKFNHPSTQVLRRDLSDIPKGYILDRLKELPENIHPVGVIGGPPCQAFSIGNVHKKKDDPRARLLETYTRILGELAAEYKIHFFVVENVLGLRQKRHKQQFEDFKTSLDKLGFNIFEAKLNAKNFGVPQERERVFVVGFNRKHYRKLKFSFPFGELTAWRTVRDAIFGLPAPVYFERRLSKKEFDHHPNHWCMKPKSQKFSTGQLKEGQVLGRPFRVLAWDKPSWTVAYGHREVHVHPTGKRRLSVYEAMLLQGFPKEYRLIGNLSEQIRMVSDAVPPPLGEVIASTIKPLLRLRLTNG